MIKESFPMTKEPPILKNGKQFHEFVQEKWSKTADGNVRIEEVVPKSNKRKGRADIFVEEIGDYLVSIVEIKNTDWNKIKPENIRRNVKRQARQLWEYIEFQTDSKGKSVSPGIIYPKIPTDLEKLKLIELILEGECIQVVWENESIEAVRRRMLNKSKSE
jgi:hypothetical protein